jgi:hypothetical protein
MRTKLNQSPLRRSLTTAFLLGAACALGTQSAAGQTPIDFKIKGGRIVTGESCVAKVTVLGAAQESTTFNYDYMIGARITIDGVEYDPWGPLDRAVEGNLCDGNNPRQWYVQMRLPEASKIGITGRSWVLFNPYGYYRGKATAESDWIHYATRRSWQLGSNRVLVLRDGDAVPDIAGFADQPSVGEFISDYIDFRTSPATVRLGRNDVIYLFELGYSPPGVVGCDYQDLVVLVTLADQLVALDAAGFACD